MSFIQFHSRPRTPIFGRKTQTTKPPTLWKFHMLSESNIDHVIRIPAGRAEMPPRPSFLKSSPVNRLSRMLPPDCSALRTPSGTIAMNRGKRWSLVSPCPALTTTARRRHKPSLSPPTAGLLGLRHAPNRRPIPVMVALQPRPLIACCRRPPPPL